MHAFFAKNRPVRWLILLVIALALIALAVQASNWWRSADSGPDLLAINPAAGVNSFSAALGFADDQVEQTRANVAASPGEWFTAEGLGRALLARAQLTGAYADLVEAGKVFDRAKADAPKGAGPVLADANYAMMVHRLDRAEADLDVYDGFVVKLDQDATSEAIALRGDIAFYRGDYRQALGYYEQARGMSDWPGIGFRIADVYAKTGAPDKALATYANAVDRVPVKQPQLIYSGLMKSGGIELMRGNWDLAETYFKRADNIFSGHWLTAAHLAQMAALRGDSTAAKRGYLAILRTADHPEVMDALAALYRTEGDGPNSRAWSAKARAVWTERLAQLPEASFGHALEHELALGDPKIALDLARKNFAARPYGDSTVLLASALLANGKAAEAERLLVALAKGDWHSAALYVLLSQAQALQGKGDAAEEARDKALAINPKAFDPAGSLIWFGHH